jgi:hypothetical protein
MKTGKPTQEMFRLLLGLVIVAAITIAIISTLRGPAPGSVTVAASPFPTSSPQQPATPPQEPTTAAPYPYPMENPLTPSAAAVAAEATSNFLATKYLGIYATFLATTPSPTPPVTIPPTGTWEDMYVKPSGEKLGLDAINAWAGIWDGKQVSVYAGALLDDPNQGAIFLISDVIANQFLTPTKHGGVRVVSERNNRLTLVSIDGTTYYFDIPALSYVSSLTAFAPSITPAPTRTPFPTKSLNGLLTPVPPTYNPYPAPTGQNTAAP